MLYAIMKETYAWPVRDGAPPLQTVGPIAAKDGFDAARQSAQDLAAKFDSHCFEGNARYPYVWAHNKDAEHLYHFVIKATQLA